MRYIVKYSERYETASIIDTHKEDVSFLGNLGGRAFGIPMSACGEFKQAAIDEQQATCDRMNKAQGYTS